MNRNASLTILVLLFLAVRIDASPAQSASHFSLTTGYGESVLDGRRGDARMSMLHLEWARARNDHSELAIVLIPSVIEQPQQAFGSRFTEPEQTVRSLGAALLYRHLFRDASAKIRPFIEASSGPMWSEERVPAATSHFNFLSTAGAGVIIRPWGENLPLVIGYRFGHISNAGIEDRNPGWNLSTIILGFHLQPQR
ncbi:MAG TPA: acyloxyacyl hydrolase [Thermoanaerobaculia bacterium]|nr:acyloxyacyl hydrolase [Thermoanaerobaculia bacterium]